MKFPQFYSLSKIFFPPRWKSNQDNPSVQGTRQSVLRQLQKRPDDRLAIFLQLVRAFSALSGNQLVVLPHQHVWLPHSALVHGSCCVAQGRDDSCGEVGIDEWLENQDRDWCRSKHSRYVNTERLRQRSAIQRHHPIPRRVRDGVGASNQLEYLRPEARFERHNSIWPDRSGGSFE